MRLLRLFSKRSDASTSCARDDFIKLALAGLAGGATRAIASTGIMRDAGKRILIGEPAAFPISYFRS